MLDMRASTSRSIPSCKPWGRCRFDIVSSSRIVGGRWPRHSNSRSMFFERVICTMEGQNVERRLAAILAADVVGYSRLMEVDEEGTLARLKTVRLELIDPAITKCKGRIIKTTGDGMLVEFHSVTEALRGAVDFHERLGRQNLDMPPY